jgi:hypothetical protein
MTGDLQRITRAMRCDKPIKLEMRLVETIGLLHCSPPMGYQEDLGAHIVSTRRLLRMLRSASVGKCIA